LFKSLEAQLLDLQIINDQTRVMLKAANVQIKELQKEKVKMFSLLF